MARDAVTINALSFNTALSNPAGNTITAANGGKITPTGSVSKILLRISHNALTDETVTVLKGDSPPSTKATNLTVTIPACDDPGEGSVVPVVRFLVLSADSFQQDDGTVLLDYSTDFDGSITAIALPKGA